MRPLPSRSIPVLRVLFLAVGLLVLMLPAACGITEDEGGPRSVTVYVGASVRFSTADPFIDLTVVQEGMAPVHIDSVLAPLNYEFGAEAGDLVSLDAKWSRPVSGVLWVTVYVDRDFLVSRSSNTPNEALSLTFWLP